MTYSRKLLLKLPRQESNVCWFDFPQGKRKLNKPLKEDFHILCVKQKEYVLIFYSYRCSTYAQLDFQPTLLCCTLQIPPIIVNGIWISTCAISFNFFYYLHAHIYLLFLGVSSINRFSVHTHKMNLIKTIKMHLINSTTPSIIIIPQNLRNKLMQTYLQSSAKWLIDL